MYSNVQRAILNTLKERGMNKKKLVDLLTSSHNITDQAAYKSIRELKKREIIVEQKKLVLLNSVWVDEQIAFFKAAQSSANNDNSLVQNLLMLADGDKVTYVFNNPNDLDILWGNYFLSLARNLEKHEPVFIFNPHFWFPLTREKSEKQLFNYLKQNHKRAYLISGSSTPLDKKILKSFFTDRYHSYSVNALLNFPGNKYINIFGDYIIEVSLDKDVSDSISSYFDQNTNVNSADKDAFQKIVSSKGKNKITISKNQKKSRKLRKRMSRDFLIPKESRQYV